MNNRIFPDFINLCKIQITFIPISKSSSLALQLIFADSVCVLREKPTL